MKKESLKQSQVVFNNVKHEYYCDGKQLTGVTPIVAWLFPKTYAGISEETLMNAANEGKRIHELCQMYDQFGTDSDEPQVETYKGLTSSYEHVCSEYLVSDNEHFASSIDKVYDGSAENCVVLGDIKCTSKLHIENVTLQLSIYALMFEEQNPKVKVEKLIAIHLPKPKYGKGGIVELQRLPDELCKEIMGAFINEPWRADELREKVMKYFFPVMNETAVVEFRDIEQDIIKLEAAIQHLKTREECMKTLLMKKMRENKRDKWEGEHVVLTIRKASTRQTLDSKKVKELHPDVYAECVKESTTGESLQIKVKNESLLLNVK